MNDRKIVDLRVDSLSVQTPEMLSAMRDAKVGDDIFGEDRATLELEEYAAELCGKDAALFVASGTMGNLVALLAHAPGGGEIILGKKSHIFKYEVAGGSALGRLAYGTVDDSRGIPDVSEVESAIREDEIYFPETALICLENTHNLAGGVAIRVEEIQPISSLAKKYSLPIHLDGARIFNACAALDVKVKEYAVLVDSMMFSLSKGLGAPAGAILTGSSEFIRHARKIRKMLGGGMRQIGYLTAPALVALKEGPVHVKRDNQNARRLADRLLALGHFRIDVERMTNILYVWLNDSDKNALHYLPQFEEAGIRLMGVPQGYRAVLHNGITEKDVEYVAVQFERIFGMNENK